MKNLPLVFFGIFAAIGFSWLSIVFASYQMLDDLEPTSSQLINPVTTDIIAGPYYFTEESGIKRSGESNYQEQQYPPVHLGLADEGERVYQDLGCYTCHTQSVRDTGLTSDALQGFGERHSVARDYIRREQIMLGNIRIGQDLSNIGLRQTDAAWHHINLYQSTYHNPESMMPGYPFLYTKQLIPGDEASEGAVQLPAPDDAFEIVPNRRAQALVAYMLSLKQNYSLPEAALPEE